MAAERGPAAASPPSHPPNTTHTHTHTHMHTYSRLSHVRNQFPEKLPFFDLMIKKLSSRAFT